jgi:acetyltransferase-like isoleucine patch superfamily enzyme
MKLKSDSTNSITKSEKINLRGSISGQNNTIELGDVEVESTLTLQIFGNNNRIKIDSIMCLKNMHIKIGASLNMQSNNCQVSIGKNFWCEDNLNLLLYNHKNIVTIGNDCLLSKNITFRLGERPHLLFDRESGNYIDNSTGVKIGNEVWVGENVYITKNASVADGCIIGVNSVVTKTFSQEQCVLAGNPAKEVKGNVKWIRNNNKRFLIPGSKYEKSYKEYESQN